MVDEGACDLLLISYTLTTNTFARTAVAVEVSNVLLLLVAVAVADAGEDVAVAQQQLLPAAHPCWPQFWEGPRLICETLSMRLQLEGTWSLVVMVGVRERERERSCQRRRLMTPTMRSAASRSLLLLP